MPLPGRRTLKDVTPVASQISPLLAALGQSPSPLAVYTGSAHKLELANAAYRNLTSTPLAPGVSARQVLTSDRDNLGWLHTLDELNQVYRTGAATRRAERQRPGAEDGSFEDRIFDVMLLPLTSDVGAIAGVIVMATEVTESARARRRAEVAASQAAAALERERQRLETVLRSQQVLVEAGTLLASSLDYDVTVNRIAQLAVPALADGCLIHMSHEGEVRRMAEAFRERDDGNSQRWIAAFEGMERTQHPITKVMNSGTTLWLRDVTDDHLMASARDEPHLEELRAAAPRSLISVPLTVRGRTLGTMSFVTTTSERRYDENAVALAEQLGQRAAWALDSALLYKSEEEARRRSEVARAEAENANRLKDTFLATVSHELRTPMAALLLWENILRAAEDEPMRARALDAIHQSAAAQSKLIEDLLDVSRCMSGKLRIDPRPVAVIPVVEAAVEVALPVANAKGIRMDCFLDQTVKQVMGDSYRLQQIVGNLLSNAIKFTDAEGRIAVRAERRRAHVEISVADTGLGIAADFLPEIFKPFTQADGSATRSQGGLGLGLAIVWQLVELHGGAVRAESAGPHRGTTIVVTLPLLRSRPAAAAAPQAGPPERDDVSLKLRPATFEPRSLAGLRVLVVDDEPRVREALDLLLRQAGAIVKTVSSAAAAVATLKRSRWGVIVSDIGMPGEDGFSFVKRLRQRPEREGGKVPAIALTAYARTEDQERAAEVGFDLHLAKPVEANVLITAIAGLARKGHQRGPAGVRFRS